jgi:hypothetical protein
VIVAARPGHTATASAGSAVIVSMRPERPEVGMVFELEMGGVHVSCSSAVWTQKLIDRGARLVGTRQEDLRQPLERRAKEDMAGLDGESAEESSREDGP